MIRKSTPPPEDPRKVLGLRLKEARTAVGMTQLQVAKLFNVEKNTVSAWETGGGLPDALRLAKLAMLYRVTPNDLVETQTA